MERRPETVNKGCKRRGPGFSKIQVCRRKRANGGLMLAFFQRHLYFRCFNINYTMEPEFGPLFDQINYRMASYIQGRYNSAAPVKERFITWWESFTTHANSSPFDLIYMEQIASSHLYPDMGKQASTGFYTETRAILQKGQEEGLVKEADLGLINQFVRGSITSILKTNISVGKTLSAEQIRHIVRFCWDGIRV